jgi:hypothetical protein
VQSVVTWQIPRRSLVAICLGTLSFLAFILTAPVAAAEAVRPSNFESVISEIDPPAPQIQVQVLGGDSYLQVTAQPGATVQIPGYDGEPYLRISAEGKVEQNRRSPAVILNSTRGSAMGGSGGITAFPSDVSSKAPPDWQLVGSGGKVAWHDHRIHWMVSDPPVVDDSRVAQDWLVPLTVNNQQVTVTGQLLYSGNTFPWSGLLAVVCAVLAAFLARSGTARLMLLFGASVCAAALSLGGILDTVPAIQSSQPLTATWLPLLLAGISALAAGLAMLAQRLSLQLRMLILPLVSVATLAGWVAPRVGLIWMPVVPSVFLGWIERGGTALVIGIISGVTIAILVRPLPKAQPGFSTDKSSGPQSAIPPKS